MLFANLSLTKFKIAHLSLHMQVLMKRTIPVGGLHRRPPDRICSNPSGGGKPLSWQWATSTSSSFGGGGDGARSAAPPSPGCSPPSSSSSSSPPALGSVTLLSGVRGSWPVRPRIQPSSISPSFVTPRRRAPVRLKARSFLIDLDLISSFLCYLDLPC